MERYCPCMNISVYRKNFSKVRAYYVKRIKAHLSESVQHYVKVIIKDAGATDKDPGKEEIANMLVESLGNLARLNPVSMIFSVYETNINPWGADTKLLSMHQVAERLGKYLSFTPVLSTDIDSLKQRAQLSDEQVKKEDDKGPGGNKGHWESIIKLYEREAGFKEKFENAIKNLGIELSRKIIVDKGEYGFEVPLSRILELWKEFIPPFGDWTAFDETKNIVIKRDHEEYVEILKKVNLKS